MKYSDETIETIIADCGEFDSSLHPDYAVVRIVIAALESTDEQKALRKFEKAYVKWALSDAGGLAEGDAFVALVEAYDAVEKARES